MLWGIREYSVPLLFALVVHALVVYALYSGWSPSRETVRVIKPRIVNSTLIMIEPKAKIAPPKAAPQKVAPKQQAPVKKPEPKKSAEPKPVEVAPQPKPDVNERARELQEAREAQRQQRLQALADSSFMNALEDETDELQENAAADNEIVAQSYRDGIYQLIVANWSRPPSARNGMQARLQVELVPTGDVVSVVLLEGSGNSAFDQSAEAAVRKARRFEVPKESAMFERYFRRFALLFRPEDLLR